MPPHNTDMNTPQGPPHKNGTTFQIKRPKPYLKSVLRTDGLGDEHPMGVGDLPPYVNTVRSPEPVPKSTKRKKKKKSKSSATTGADQGEIYEVIPVASDRRDRVMATVGRLGYTDDEISMATQRLDDSNQELTYDSLIDMAFIVQQEVAAESDTIDGTAVGGAEGGYQPHQHLDHESDGGDVSDNESQDDCQELLRRAIEKKKMELRADIESLTFQCKVCRCSRATILLLPCGHLASCDDCLMDVRRCPIARCNKVVRGTKEVYFS